MNGGSLSGTTWWGPAFLAQKRESQHDYWS